MRKVLLVLFVIVIGLVISACTSQVSSTSLIGSWRLTAYGPAASPSPAVADTQAGLTFEEDGTLTGNGGCNGLGGEYTVEGNQITFGQIISTLMACDSPIMDQESAVVQVLTGTADFSIGGDTVTLTNNDMVLVLTR